MAEKVLMKGNEALAEAALRAGCRFFFGYPITPQTELAAYMSKQMCIRDRSRPASPHPAARGGRPVRRRRIDDRIRLAADPPAALPPRKRTPMRNINLRFVEET